MYNRIFNLVAIDIFFNESTYDVLESDQYIQLVLVLSNPSATDITIQVTDNNGTTSESENLLTL